MDQKTLAYINLYAVLGALGPLCQLSEEARAILGDSRMDLAISVKDGPKAMLRFENGGMHIVPGAESCEILLKFNSPEKFNGMINGTVTPFPVKGLTKLGFLLKKFTKLTGLLTRYLKPTEEALQDEEFFRVSTTLLFYVIVEAAAQVGDHDRIGTFSAGWMVDGNVRLAVLPDGPEAYLAVKDHRLTAVHEKPAEVMSAMEFQGIHTARDLFDGKVASFPLICDGKIVMKGMISQIDNVNRILDRVGRYLA